MSRSKSTWKLNKLLRNYLLYRMLINGGAGSGEINVLINLISHQPDIDKIYFCAKDSFEAKYQ